MPELPEIQTTVNGLQAIINNKIDKIKVNTLKLRYLVPQNIDKITQKRQILQIYRIAKYIIIDLSGNVSLIFHLGMSGRIKLQATNDYKRIKHDHILIYLHNKKIVVYNDPRKFGFFDSSLTSELKNKEYILKLGLDSLGSSLTKHYLFNKFKYSKSTIKQLLLNQKIITGIGNIYACEILYDAKISPFIPGDQLDIKMIEQLIQSIRKILKKAILSGGTTLRNYVASDGTIGNFQNKFKVYNKENKTISKFKIRRIKQSGRSTFFCPELQLSKYNPTFLKK